MNNASSTKPYLLRALFDWCVDNDYTPYVVVQVDKHVRVPMAYVRDGQIVLNIAPYATNQLSITNEDLSCQARFNGAVQSLYVPIENILAIYARETGQGMAFERGLRSGTAMELGGNAEDARDETDSLDSVDPDMDKEETGAESAPSLAPVVVKSLDTKTPSGSDDSDPTPPATPPRTPHLRVIK